MKDRRGVLALATGVEVRTGGEDSRVGMEGMVDNGEAVAADGVITGDEVGKDWVVITEGADDKRIVADDKREVADVGDCSGDTLSVTVKPEYGLSEDTNSVDGDNVGANIDDVSIVVRKSVAGVEDFTHPLCVSVTATVDTVSDKDKVGLIVNSTLSLLLDGRLTVTDDTTEELMISLCTTDEKGDSGNEIVALDKDSTREDPEEYGRLTDSVPLAV